jgi:hypothetical protein
MKLIRIAAAALVFATPTAFAEVKQLELSGGHQKDQYCDIHLGDTVYHLPVAEYSIGAGPCDEATNHAVINFSLILPDLEPVTANPSEAAQWGKGTGFHRELHILVEYYRNFISQTKMIDEAFEDSVRSKISDQQYVASHPESATKFANKHYLDRDVYVTLPNGCKKYFGPTLAGDVIQICKVNDYDDDFLFVRCNTLMASGKSIPYPVCTVMINIGDKTQLTYSFGYNYFNQALDIHKKLLALLATFRLPT